MHASVYCTHLADLGDEESSHSGSGSSSQRVRDLEALQAVARLGLLADHVQHGVDQLGSLSVVSLGPEKKKKQEEQQENRKR